MVSKSSLKCIKFTLAIRDKCKVVKIDDVTGVETVVLDLSLKLGFLRGVGLLGLATHPRFNCKSARKIYVHYSTVLLDGELGSHNSVISEFTYVNGRFPLLSERVLLKINQPTLLNNGGALAFGPGNYLYIGVGNSGNLKNNIDPSTLLGKILRIGLNRVITTDREVHEYSIPPTNPFAKGGGLPEIYKMGFANPILINFIKNIINVLQ